VVGSGVIEDATSSIQTLATRAAEGILGRFADLPEPIFSLCMGFIAGSFSLPLPRFIWEQGRNTWTISYYGTPDPRSYGRQTTSSSGSPESPVGARKSNTDVI